MSASSNREESLFERALEFSTPEAREAYLREACGDDAVLRESLLGLLRAHDRAGQFLEHKLAEPGAGLAAALALGVPPSGGPQVVPPSGGAAPGPAEAGTPNETGNAADEAVRAPSEKPGERIGRYKLLEQIGEGGMGTVWMAEQEEPVRRRVALKIIKLGMDTRSVIARFEAERQALALMDHPNIARVFDGGVTGYPLPSDGRGAGGEGAAQSEIGNRKSEIPQGRPYFVMELVRGLPITRCCDEAKLSTRDRLELFKQVCRAVQHAHQKGIIHRDLKPSNILVTEQDGRPVAKVIDFGVAKATEGRLTDKTLFTGFAQLIGTPTYMSPEQAGLGGLDIDTRSDTYSLGVVLYELLTGRPPFDTKELLKQGYDAVLRTIREVDPPKPSTRLTDLVAADVRRLTSNSELGTRNSEMDRASSRRLLQQKRELISAIRGDLDWIVMKCLEKDRNRRYDTANSLALDLERYLHDEPVTARPPSSLYRIQKLVRRNTVAFAAGTAVAAALVIGLSFSTFSFFREREARKRALTAESEQTHLRHEAEAARTNEIRLRLDAEQQRDRARTAEAEANAVLRFFESNVLAAPRPEKGLGRNVTLREAVDAAERSIASAFTNRPAVEASIRSVLGTTYRQLGDPAKAIPQHERSLALVQEQLSPDRPSALRAMNDLALAYQEAGRLHDALPLLEKTMLGYKAQDGSTNRHALNVMNNLATVLQELGRFDEARGMLEELVPISRAIYGTNDVETLTVMGNLASAYYRLGRFDTAVPLQEEVVALTKSRVGAEHLTTLLALANLARMYIDVNQPTNAISLIEGMLGKMKDKLGADHPDTLAAMNNLARAYTKAHRPSDAFSLLEDVLRLNEAKFGPDHPATIKAINSLGVAHRNAGRPADAVPLLEKAVKLHRAKLGPDHFDTLAMMNNLASAYRSVGRLDEALRLQEDTVKQSNSALGPRDPRTLAFISNLAKAYLAAGRAKEAIPLWEGALKLQRLVPGQEHRDTLSSMSFLAGAYMEAKQFTDAGNLFRELLTAQSKILASDSRTLADTMVLLGESLVRQDKFSEAEPHLRECLSIYQKQEPEEALIYRAQGLLGWALLGQEKYAEAEPLLVIAQRGLTQGDARRLSRSRAQLLRDIVQRLVRLYEDWGKPEQAAEWREKLSVPAKPLENVQP